MSLEYIDQLVTYINTFRQQVEAQTTEADELRKQLETVREQLKSALATVKELQKLQVQITDRDAEINKLTSTILDGQQRLSNERRRSEQLRSQRDTLQKNLDVIKATFNLGEKAERTAAPKV